MTFGKTLAFVAICSFSFQAFADELQINPNRPDRYTVVRGDTLWDISARFLQRPWRWPELWHGNPQIENPHLIYPGDVLHFEMINGTPRIRVSRGREMKLYPHIRKSVLDEAIKEIPTDAISQFLTSPKVLDDENELKNSPYVVDFPDEHIVAGAGDRVYVREIQQPKTLKYTFYRQGQPYVNPENKEEILGYDAMYLGEGILNRAGDPATLTITKSNGEIRIGDRIMPTTEEEQTLSFKPRAPTHKVEGSILSVLKGVSQIGQHNLVVIDRGTDNGIEVGHVLDIYQKGRTIEDTVSSDRNRELLTLPDEQAGVLMVFRPFKRVSYAIVMNATAPIHLLDKVKTPR